MHLPHYSSGISYRESSRGGLNRDNHVLATCTGSRRMYAVCISFYELALTTTLAPSPDDAHSDELLLERLFLWVPKCICLTSSLPITGFAMTMLYQLLDWATPCNVCPLPYSQKEDTGEDIASLISDYKNATISLIQSAIVRMTLEIPRPVPGVLAIDSGEDIFGSVTRLSIPGCELPSIPFSLLPLFSLFPAELVIDLWAHVLVGDRILIVGSQVSSLTIIAESILPCFTR